MLLETPIHFKQRSQATSSFSWFPLWPHKDWYSGNQVREHVDAWNDKGASRGTLLRIKCAKLGALALDWLKLIAGIEGRWLEWRNFLA